MGRIQQPDLQTIGRCGYEWFGRLLGLRPSRSLCEVGACGKVAGVAGLEPVTSAVTGQRSNQLSYTPAKGDETIVNLPSIVKFWFGFL